MWCTVDLHADSTEAMQAVVAKLHKEYGIGESADLVGDQKTYSCICELKQEYGTELDWVIPLVTGTFSPTISLDESVP